MKTKTVRVRIAVAVDETGDYDVHRVADNSDDDAAEWAQERLEDGNDGGSIIVHFIEADVPLPVSAEIKGKVRP
jgi:hypothetical protein